MLTSFRALTAGQEPPVHVQPMDLGAYARYMAAPHRMDLMVSSMEKDGAWHCNQKCLHCYAANQPLSAVPELDTDQWLAVIEKCRNAGIPQLTFTGGEPTLRHDLVKLVQAAQWFVTRLNTNGRMLTSMMCKGNCGKPDPHQSALRTASPDGEVLISIIPHLAHFFHCQPGKSVVL